MKTLSLTALLLASALTLAACNRDAAPAANNNAAAKPAETNTPAPAPAPAANDAAEAEGGGEAGAPTATVGTARQNFSVVNATGHIVVTLNVSPTSENEWGDDILGSSVMQPGQTAQVVFDRAEEQCNYDIRATYDDGDTSDVRNVNLCQVGTVNLVNQ
ncbi:MAG TPA: hypothetical protein VMG08_06560 [Allosphingosinicella sp.]|nr:hypothetical protein [Allosphingosinicella sp.]